MQVILDGQGLEVTDGLRTLTEKKLERIEKHVPSIQKIHIAFKVSKNRQIADATVTVPNSLINAEAESEDMYKTVDLLIEKLLAQLTKYKEKRTNHHRHANGHVNGFMADEE